MCHEPVILNLRDRVKPGGSLAAVIFEPSGSFAFKLFKSSSHRDHRDHPMPDSKIRAYFISELEAYRIVSADPELAKHLPIFHGIAAIASVVDEDGSDVSS